MNPPIVLLIGCVFWVKSVGNQPARSMNKNKNDDFPKYFI